MGSVSGGMGTKIYRMNTAQLVGDDFFDVTFDDSYLPYFKAYWNLERENPKWDDLPIEKYDKMAIKSLLKLQCYEVTLEQVKGFPTEHRRQFVQPIIDDEAGIIHIFLSNDYKLSHLDCHIRQDINKISSNYSLKINFEKENLNLNQSLGYANPTHVVIVADRMYITKLVYED